MLSIRLRRTGTTKRPYYRVVVADSKAWRDGRFVETLGHYDPRKNPAVVKIDAERAQYWISKGAKPSETVRSLLKRKDVAGHGVKELLETLARELVDEPDQRLRRPVGRRGRVLPRALRGPGGPRLRHREARPNGRRAAHGARRRGAPARHELRRGDRGLTAR